MNIGGLLYLSLFGIIIAPFSQVLLLNLGFAFLRNKTNGLHMPTKISCFAFSLAFQYLCLLALRYLQPFLSFEAIIMLISSTILILGVAPCNNSAIHLSDEELIVIKKHFTKDLYYTLLA